MRLPAELGLQINRDMKEGEAIQTFAFVTVEEGRQFMGGTNVWDAEWEVNEEQAWMLIGSKFPQLSSKHVKTHPIEQGQYVLPTRLRLTD